MIAFPSHTCSHMTNARDLRRRLCNNAIGTRIHTILVSCKYICSGEYTEQAKAKQIDRFHGAETIRQSNQSVLPIGYRVKLSILNHGRDRKVRSNYLIQFKLESKCSQKSLIKSNHNQNQFNEINLNINLIEIVQRAGMYRIDK